MSVEAVHLDQSGVLLGEGSGAGAQSQLITGPFPRLEREYVWGPGDKGLDELLVQYDKDRAPWWMLSDDGGDVVAMCSVGPPAPDGSLPSALVSGQWSFDAYGSVVDCESFNSNAPVNRCGHKGLFADRLDGGVVVSSGGADVPGLARGAVLLYQDRNRVVAADLGRFLQVDPNATALALLGSETHHGRATRALLATLDMEQLHSDGANLYAYLRAGPLGRRDPLGLYSFVDGVEDAMDIMNLLDPLPSPGDIVRGMYQSLCESYIANLSWDVDWATDWDLPDEMNTRMDNSWVPEAIKEGAYSAFDIEIPFTHDTINPLDLFAKAIPAPHGPHNTGRVHGNLHLHFKPILKVVNYWKTFKGVVGLWVNRALRDESGKILRGPNGETLLPDVQFWKDGKLHIWEIVNTHFDPDKLAKYKEILRHNGFSESVLHWHGSGGP